MKSIKTTELVLGNIFAKEIKLNGRESFIVESTPEGKNYIDISSRITGKKQRMFINPLQWVILLK